LISDSLSRTLSDDTFRPFVVAIVRSAGARSASVGAGFVNIAVSHATPQTGPLAPIVAGACGPELMFYDLGGS
jgi:hypothetical protein